VTVWHALAQKSELLQHYGDFFCESHFVSFIAPRTRIPAVTKCHNDDGAVCRCLATFSLHSRIIMAHSHP
jgi:hypothetical protein